MKKNEKATSQRTGKRIAIISVIVLTGLLIADITFKGAVYKRLPARIQNN